MNWAYAERKIREALQATEGDEARARKKIAALAEEDVDLLRALSSPHMTGIIAHAVGHVASKKEPEAPLPEPDLAPDPKNTFGLEILKSIAGGGSARFGQENSVPPVRKQAASQRHIDAIKQMVSGRNGEKPE